MQHVRNSAAVGAGTRAFGAQVSTAAGCV